ncbi:hypothetical protein PFBG_05178 [Plasmodium falciparum 7G8]|uniref:Uncharacterized protein n=1 Tax=Plasmodium falciparum (isolate 7G8) TaxID=57266 RepID=W7F1N4_PLAF8|nr:hypothetical protein PFBG_05178 [Plasmodium falciparum 7G8]
MRVKQPMKVKQLKSAKSLKIIKRVVKITIKMKRINRKRKKHQTMTNTNLFKILKSS